MSKTFQRIGKTALKDDGKQRIRKGRASSGDYLGVVLYHLPVGSEGNMKTCQVAYFRQIFEHETSRT
jgi:hypothetical protein